MARGGYRPGAGRKKGSKGVKRGTGKSGEKKIPADIAAAAASENMTPLEYMLKIMNDPGEDKEMRARMAIAAAPFVHARATESKGKKQDREEKAKAAGSGKFATGVPPVIKRVK